MTTALPGACCEQSDVTGLCMLLCVCVRVALAGSRAGPAQAAVCENQKQEMSTEDKDETNE